MMALYTDIYYMCAQLAHDTTQCPNGCFVIGNVPLNSYSPDWFFSDISTFAIAFSPNHYIEYMFYFSIDKSWNEELRYIR